MNFFLSRDSRNQIFFPRSIEGEIAAKDIEKERKRSRTGHSTFGHSATFLHSYGPSRINTLASETYSFSQPTSAIGHDRTKPLLGGVQAYPLKTSPSKSNFRRNSFDGPLTEESSQPGQEARSDGKYWDEEQRDVAAPLPPMRPNRRRGTEVELGGFDKLTETNLSVHNLRLSNVNPLVHNFTSPIGEWFISFPFISRVMLILVEALGYAAEPETNTVQPKYTFKK